MKKLGSLLFLGLAGLSLSSVLYAQSLHFGKGGYSGPSLEPITIADLADVAPNDFVIVSGTIIQQRVPGRYVLADGEGEDQVSVVVRIGPYEWGNIEVDDATSVMVYGTVLKSPQSAIEILAERVGLPEEE
jgi:uncharacterized protein YdeI (BOF family)